MATHLSADLVRRALEQLLLEHELGDLQDDLVVKESVTRSAHKLYVIRALNGAEQAVKHELSKVCGPRAYCGAGTWVLRQEEAVRLVAL